MAYILVGIGGMTGGIMRFLLGKAISTQSNLLFPLGTFIINISGALALGVLVSANPGNDMLMLLGDGFCGAYTTFSTFMYEGFDLFKGREALNAVVYIVGTLALGIGGFMCGAVLGGLIA